MRAPTRHGHHNPFLAASGVAAVAGRSILGILAAAIVLAAGCAAPDPRDAATSGDAELAGAAGAPATDAAAFLARYEAFVTEHPRRLGGHADHEAARAALLAGFADAGLETWRHDFGSGSNLVGVHWGSSRDEWVVVGAHYDMTHPECTPGAAEAACTGVSQGAYDNGSGTMLMAELARLFAAVPTTRTIAFVAFDDHEAEGLQGSLRFLQAVAAGETPWGSPDLAAALVMDMFGLTWPGIDAPIHAYGSESLEDVVDEVRKRVGVPDDMVVLGNPGPYAGGDDGRFLDAGVPTVAFDSAFDTLVLPTGREAPRVSTPLGIGVYPFYHRLDTWATMTEVAGGPERLEMGFQTALDVLAGTLCEVAC